MADVTDLVQSPANDALRLSEREQTILKLWDQEEEVRLEINILQAQNDLLEDDLARLSEEDLKVKIATAERELLEARTSYNLRNRIIQNVLIADPVLKAIHAGSSATELDTRLLPLINERDVISMVHSTLSTKLHSQKVKLAALERENEAANAKNKDLAQAMLEVAHELKAEKVEEVQDARLRTQLETLEDDIRKTRREWRVLKSLTASVVAGSGVDWTKDPKLLELVMDEEDEIMG